MASAGASFTPMPDEPEFYRIWFPSLCFYVRNFSYGEAGTIIGFVSNPDKAGVWISPGPEMMSRLNAMTNTPPILKPATFGEWIMADNAEASP